MSAAPERLAIVLRTDLAPGFGAAQAIHAAREFQRLHPDAEGAWHSTSNTVAVLAADPDALGELRRRCGDLEVPHAVFEEPDLPEGDRFTALAIAAWTPLGKRLTRKLPLWG